MNKITLNIFFRAKSIFSGWMADKTKIKVEMSIVPTGTTSAKSSFVISETNALQLLESYNLLL